MYQPNYEKAKNEAEKLLKKFAYIEPNVNPIEISKEMDIPVHSFKASTTDEEKISGLFYQNKIYVNEKEPTYRQTFTIAHELGHYILHKDWINTNNYQVLYRRDMVVADDPKEKEANCFAANLLVPKFMLDRFHKFASVDELATLFCVSKAVIRNRLVFEYE
ncbi:MAG: ImmA/IrrE family metallo-endopeptidase [Alphaproteobacteria bacterium]|nr:ImmA/IrrE family metallo-endopeptidase [Alphaproteobacteria bacterium]